MLSACRRLATASLHLAEVQTLLLHSQFRCASSKSPPTTAAAMRSKKSKSKSVQAQHFVDVKQTRTTGGRGGDGCVSFLSLWCNENAGPDGADGGNGGHVVFEASFDVNNFGHVKSIVKAEDGEKGGNKDCHGKNANHHIVKVPVGTIVKNDAGQVVGDLNRTGLMFVAARGGAGGKGNRFFTTEAEQAPKVCEFGAHGEDRAYVVELRSMAHIGLIGLPNAGKSTLLRAITRAKPKVAAYPFTTLKPHLGMVEYDDYVQISIADLPGLIPGSHLNKGLGIQFLKHAERCAALLFILDASAPEPWTHFEQLQYEIRQFSEELAYRPQIIVANKIDRAEAQENLAELRRRFEVEQQIPVIQISAKMGTNVTELLTDVRTMYDRLQSQEAIA